MAYSIVGSPEYMSPEVLGETGYGAEVDWWSLGCNFFEIILGVPPISADSPEEIFECISNWQALIPPLLSGYKEYMSDALFDLISRLLAEPSTRLGVNGVEEIMAHPFFAGLNWDLLRAETPPFIPRVRSGYKMGINNEAEWRNGHVVLYRRKNAKQERTFDG